MNKMSTFFHSSSDHLTEVLSLWKSNRFFRARLQRARLTRLQDSMTEGVNLCQILQITVGIVKQLHYLHVRGLAQKQLEIEDIYVKVNKSVSQKKIVFLRVCD